jgi:hypothetical protein
MKVKIEKRGDSCFISHNGLTLFFNKRVKDEMLGVGDYQIRVQKRERDGQWHLVGEMQVEKAAYLELLILMKELMNSSS